MEANTPLKNETPFIFSYDWLNNSITFVRFKMNNSDTNIDFERVSPIYLALDRLNTADYSC